MPFCGFIPCVSAVQDASRLSLLSDKAGQLAALLPGASQAAAPDAGVVMSEPACLVGPELHHAHWAGLGAWAQHWDSAWAGWGGCESAACMRLRYILLLAAVVTARYAVRLARARALRRRAAADLQAVVSGVSPRGSSGCPAGGSPRAAGHAHAHAQQLPELPALRSPARSEAAKEAEAEATARALQQALPPGPQYLSREDLVAAVKPSDAQLALCALYSNRCAHPCLLD